MEQRLHVLVTATRTVCLISSLARRSVFPYWRHRFRPLPQQNKHCTESFSFSFKSGSKGGISLAFRTTAWASWKRFSPTAASTRLRQASSLGRLSKILQPALTGCGEESSRGRAKFHGLQGSMACFGLPPTQLPPPHCPSSTMCDVPLNVPIGRSYKDKDLLDNAKKQRWSKAQS